MLLRKLAALILASLVACAPVSPPATPVATQTATLPATPAVPDYYVHPARVGLGTIDVLSTWCKSEHTTIAVYSYQVVWYYDDDATTACIAKGKLE